MKNKRFWDWARDSDERVLYFDGEISEETWWGDEITPRLFRDELFSGEGDITVWLNSPGGDCVAASQIYAMLMDYRGNVTVKIDGIAASAASVIAMAGTSVLMAPTALMMIHRRNAKFLMKDGTISALRKLKDANGAYLWQPSVQAGQPDRLLGYPIYTSPYVPDVAASALPIAFGDFSNYWICDRLGRTVQRLNELYSTNGQVGFICTQRVDGKVILAEGIQLLRMGA